MSSCFTAAEILLPKADVPVSEWACIACDQFTSDESYWENAQNLVGYSPSSLYIVLPEVYIEKAGAFARVENIHDTMQTYKKDVLTRKVSGFVYVERTMQSGAVRKGIVGKIDLEQYSYRKGEFPAVRPTEGTVLERIPPRVAVRRDAVIETPHVMMLIDDEAQTVIEPISNQKANLNKVYEGDLMLGGGSICGWAVESAELIAAIENAVITLGSSEIFDARYPQVAGAKPLTMAVGDGNHSLASAKAFWEELKPTLSPEDQLTHPARYCLCEVCNIHSDAIEMEPIHRVLFETDGADVYEAWEDYCEKNELDLEDGKADQVFTLVSLAGEEPFAIRSPKEPLTVGTVDAFIAEYLNSHKEVRVDYIHEEEAVRNLCDDGAVGILLPTFAKSDLFKGVVQGGVLPRKTFSMGQAVEKRYYLECRNIVNENI